ncbi:MAG: hypothetical protein ACF8R7_03600 [Phycisphaerales bacterium JB039]
MPDKRLAGAIALMVAGAISNAATAQMLDDFEHGDPGRYAATGGGSIQLRADAAYNGSLGARVSSPTDDSWFSRAEDMTAAGRTYRTWVRIRGEGVASVGVDADHPDGPVRAALSALPFQHGLRLERPLDFGGLAVAAAYLDVEPGRWYQLELAWNDTGRMAAQVYDEGGVMLAQTGLIFVERYGSGPAAFRATGDGADFDDFRAISCPGDCDGSGKLDFFDFLCFQTQFASGSMLADCDSSGTLDFFDFLCFQTAFAEGCPAEPVVTKHGSSTVPSVVCGESVTAFGPSGVPDGTKVDSVTGPLCGQIRFSRQLEKSTASASWGHGYGGDTYFNIAGGLTSIMMPPGTTRFRLSLRAIVLLDREFTVAAVGRSGVTQTTKVLNGTNPADVFSFCDEEGLLGVYVTGPDWYTIGEFAIDQQCATVDALGSSAPLLAMCGAWMHNFSKDTRPTFTDFSDVPTPLGDRIHFSIPLQHRAVGFGWPSWSHGYTGDVYFTNGSRSVTITAPEGTRRFRFYAQPSAFEDVQIRVSVNGGDAVSQTVSGAGGAKGFGVCGPVHSVTVSTPLLGGVKDFAIGEFSIAQ